MLVDINSTLVGQCKNLGVAKIASWIGAGLFPEMLTPSRHHWPLMRYVKLRVAHAPGTFSPPLRVSDPDMHHGMCVTHVPWCMLGSLTRCFLWSRLRGKRSWHFQCMRNPQFYASGKRPILNAMWNPLQWDKYARDRYQKSNGRLDWSGPLPSICFTWTTESAKRNCSFWTPSWVAGAGHTNG